MKKPLNGLTLFGLITVFTLGSALATSVAVVLWGEKDMWWTPSSMALSLEDTADDFQVLVGKVPLAQILEQKRLMALDGQGNSFKVVARDIGVRKNNWPGIKSRELTKSVFLAFGFGVGLTCLVVGLWTGRKKAASGSA